MKNNLKKSIKNWLTQISEEESIPSDIVALNFNLAEPYSLSLVGACWYDEEDSDWACEEDFTPEHFECPDFKIPDSIFWEEVLTLVAEILKELLVENPELQVFTVKHIAVGFVDGDLIKIK
ncbi:hypothetical protein [Capnocytophaga sp.]|uniref:hypothetical protein n=1 Tax=Capnocytophaga sp. TaxID=44737 RepID=UPI0026DB3663|nr:hypothetical protein [Capnocytophaga sp.]MDO5106094.1 hypothetical protein [Capnocytophaga sp.]